MRRGRRGLIWVVAGVVLAGVMPALGVRLTSDGDEERGVPPSGVIPEPREERPFVRLIDRVTIDGPYRERGVSVFVLRVAGAEDQVDYLTLDEGVASGQLVIREWKERRVDELSIRNESKRYAFLMAGEVVTGGLQNRTVREDVLLAPGGGWVGLPVYCVERGRWKGGEGVGSAKTAAPGNLRSGLNQGFDQEGVWGEVSRQQEEQGIASETGDVNRVYEDAKRSREIREVTEGLMKRMPRPRECVGLVIARGRRIVSADVFANSMLYGRLHGKIIQGHVAEAYKERGGEGPPETGEVRGFLMRVHGARVTVRPGWGGEGEMVEVRGNGVGGRALEYGGRCVHVALFPEMGRPIPLAR